MWPLIAMENALFGEPALDWEARCAVIAEAGFAGIYATPYPLVRTEFARLARLGEAPARHGLKLAGVYANLDLALSAESEAAGLVTHLFETVTGVSRVELSFKCSQPTVLPADLAGAIAARLEPLLAIADRRGFDIALYHHSFYPLETPAQAEAIVRRIGHPRLKFIFATSHAYALAPAEDVLGQLRACAPRIASFNICGCRRPAPPAKCRHFPLDEGDFDLAPLFAALGESSYRGEVIVQGHGWQGDLRAALRRSVAAFRNLRLRALVIRDH